MILLNKAKNYIINGAFDYWQRGSSFVVSGAYTADRYVVGKTGTMVCNVAKDVSILPTFTQSGFVYPSSLSLTIGTAQPSLAANDNIYIYQRIEGNLFASLAGKTMTFSFWVRTSPSAAGTYAISFKNANIDRSYVTTFTVDNSGLWQRKSITLTHDLSGTWNYANGTGLLVSISLAAGSNQHSPALNTWLNGNYSSHSTSSNFAASTSNTFNITGVQLEEGIEASNFERAGGNIVSELILCQRYFEKSFEIDFPPSNGINTTSLSSQEGLERVPGLSNNGALSGGVSIPYKAQKRLPAFCTIFGNSLGQPSSGAMNTLSPLSATNTYSAFISVASQTDSRCMKVIQNSTNGTYIAVTFHWTADAEL